MTPGGYAATRGAQGGLRPSRCLGQPDGSLRDRWLFQPENLTALADLLNLRIDKMHNRQGDRATTREFGECQIRGR
jgi:hypothetical protein